MNADEIKMQMRVLLDQSDDALAKKAAGNLVAEVITSLGRTASALERIAKALEPRDVDVVEALRSAGKG